MRRKDIIARVVTLAPSQGFSFNGGSQGISVIKKALQRLNAERKIFRPQPNWWQLADDPDTGGPGLADPDPQESDLQDSIDGDELEDQEFGQEIEGIAYDGTSSRLRIERTIGEGPESVYLYYHDVHAEFAATKGLFVWECKIGRTIGEPNARIIGQGALTCFPRPPIVGLLIRTHDGRSTEALLHSALVLAERRIDQGGGSEWFITSPDRVSDWFSACLASISILSSNATREPGASSTTSSIPNLSEPS